MTDQARTEPEERYVSRKEAAAICGCHPDTIRRYEDRDRLPNKVVRDGKVMIPVSDLVAAGLLDPLANTENIEQLAASSRAERDLAALRQEHAVLQARYEAERARAERAEADVAFFKKLLESKAVA